MKRMKKETIVIALGGNAIIRKGQEGTIKEQFANTRLALEGVVDLISQGHNIVITHGNGPQVGNILIRVEESLDEAYEVPLGVCVAESEGEMGYMIEQSLQNKLHLSKIRRNVAAILTQVVVKKDDPSIKNPTKPIGPFYTKKQAAKLKKRGIKVIEDSGRGYRRVVPSPKPLDIVEKEVIKKLVKSGIIIIACGGGGMPVYIEPDGRYEGVDGVVDKDLASSVLATDIKADKLIILTGVQKVSLNYGRPGQVFLSEITVKEAEKFLKQGHFPPGSMGPKIQAAIDFLKKGGKEVIITLPETIVEAIEGETGTRIVK